MADQQVDIPVGYVRRLTRNAMRCEGCGDIIESKHRDDMRFCSCGALAVDGGLVYQRILYRDAVARTDLAEWELIPCPEHWFIDDIEGQDPDKCVMCKASR